MLDGFPACADSLRQHVGSSVPVKWQEEMGRVQSRMGALERRMGGMEGQLSAIHALLKEAVRPQKADGASNIVCPEPQV